MIALAVLASTAQAGTLTIAVRERLNQAYDRELVSVPFSAESGACVPNSLQVAGPDGPVAVQLSDVVYHTAGQQWVKSATAWFIIEKLEPLTSKTYTLTWGTSAVEPVTTDLQAKVTDHLVELSTASVAVSVPRESKAWQGVPAPLQSMRLGNISSTTPAEWRGTPTITEWTTELVDSGPVFACTVTTYTMADATSVSFATTVIAGDNTARWEMNVSGDQPELGVRFALPAVPGVKEAILPKGYGQWAKDRKAAVGDQEEGFVSLSPDSSIINIWTTNPSHILFAGENGAVELSSLEPGAWVEPGPPQTYGTTGLKHWDLQMVGEMWKGWQRKVMPVRYTAEGVITLDASFAGGRRLWRLGTGTGGVGDTLNKRLHMILDWEDTAPHPHLFVDQGVIDATWERAANDPALAKTLSRERWAGSILAVPHQPAGKLRDKAVNAALNPLNTLLGKLGEYDVMRQAIRVAATYDALINSDLISAEQRQLYRAQMAYLGYLMADPQCWSSERGYGSGNPNMHVSYTLSLGIIACALKDHPMAKTWSDYATAWMNAWLDREVGENGEWIPEGSHYGLVSLEPQLAYAIAAKRAGFHDFTTDPRLKKEILYFIKMKTPPDPQRGNVRVTGAWGRGTSGDALAIAGIAARMTADTDPDYAKVMQWMWAQTGFPGHVGDFRLGGYELYYLDRSLPQAAPAWQSELFPQLGVLLRSHFTTPQESYLNVLAAVDSERNLDVWTPGIGDISQWYGLGVPLSTCFTVDTGYKVRHELLSEGVRLARNYTPGSSMAPFGYYTKTTFGTFASMPGTDYVRSHFEVTRPDDRDWAPPGVPAFPDVTPAKSSTLAWTRQLLYLKNDAGAYIVLRDTTTGGEPTAWQFWTLSEKLGTPSETADAEAFLADKPGKASVDARQLADSDRYTALGQLGVDVEYFIAEPTATPRHTLRFGGEYRRVPEYQDALLLQQPGDGSYFVVIMPRQHEAKAPVFTREAAGKVIKVVSAAATDHLFLVSKAARATAGNISFEGTAGAVQQSGALTRLTLGAAGSVSLTGNGLAAPFAAELVLGDGAATLHLPDGCPGGQVVVTLNGKPHPLTVPAGASTQSLN